MDDKHAVSIIAAILLAQRRATEATMPGEPMMKGTIHDSVTEAVEILETVKKATAKEVKYG